MKILFAKRLGIFAIGSLLVLAGCQTSGSSKGESQKTTSSSAVEEDSSKTQKQTSESHTHEHSHDHSHAHDEESEKIYEGYFKNNQVKDRSLSDWEGDWQSVYPYLQDGTLDEVFSYKSEHEGDKTAEEYKEYYKKGYKTDVE
ncbi:ZinT/AdcA family metal-binding protein, partial [Bacillus sp. S10C12M]|nr:metal-binding protein ZinT [Bacillus sp. S10C12M]